MVDFAEFKKFFLFNLIGSLIISAIVAVITILIGNFNDTTGKVFFTLLMVIIHSLISLGFIWNDEKQNTFENLAFFSDVLFTLIVISFITAILGIWEVVEGETILNLYQTYFILGFAALHGDILSKALNKETYMDMIIYVNYLFMALVVILLQPIIYLSYPFRDLGEVFFRILGAIGIIDGTLSILTMIFYKLYMNKHPKMQSPLQTTSEIQTENTKKKGWSIWIWILLIYLFAQIIVPFFFYGIGLHF